MQIASFGGPSGVRGTRLDLAAGEDTARAAELPTLLLVTAGAVSFLDADNAATTLAAGDVFGVDAGVSFHLTGQADCTVLLIG